MEQNSVKIFSAAATASVVSVNETGNEKGAALFIINLCTSMAPITGITGSLPGLASYRLYQVARAEDGRTRHRLRLGFFASEADAEKVLVAVRTQYPTAFTTCLGDEDRKFTRGFVAENAPSATTKPATTKPPMFAIDNDSTRPLRTLQPAPAARTRPPVSPTVSKPAPAPIVAVAKIAPTPTQPAASESAIIEIDWQPEAPVQSAAQAPVPQPATEAVEIEMSWAPDATAPNRVAADHNDVRQAPSTPTRSGAATVALPPPAVIALTLAVEPAATVVSGDSATSAAHPPFHVGKGIELPAIDLTLAAENPAPKAAPANSAAATARGEPLAARAAQATPVRAALTAKPGAPAARSAGQPTPGKSVQSAAPPPARLSQADLDSTQTIRALTETERNDESQEKWFAIQLAVSEQPVNLDAMPRLDIFEAYRLYSIVSAGSGRISHSLRLGFFREHVSADAVSGYLKTFFPHPSIVAVSVAEQVRFKDPPVSAPVVDNQADKTVAKVVALSAARARNSNPIIPTVTMAVPRSAASDASPTGSFKAKATGSFNRAATGVPRTLKPATKGTTPLPKRAQTPATNKKVAAGQHRAPPKKSLSQQLADEAREIDLSESAIRRLPKSGSLLARLVGKLSK